ncbi:MAG: TrbG/VirB9 family P-type conjugative transfer protein [Pseudomonadota bacterium]
MAQDSRLVSVVYDEETVVRNNGKPKVQATIKFRNDESIENVAIGDSQAWQVTPNKRANLLFVKPLAPNASTNMTVVTNKRTYLFDLVSSPRNKPMYVLQFSYPEAEAAEEAARLARIEREAQERANATELAAANDPYAVADPTKLNFLWDSEGDKDLVPVRAFDNGDATFLTWPEGTAIPAILVTNHDGDEGPVNFTVRGDTVVVQGVPAQIILRSGDDTATLTNTGPIRSVSLDPSSNAAVLPNLVANTEKK